jgi:Dolichyl-phosphate-mannose-protein mannosyltransferase
MVALRRNLPFALFCLLLLAITFVYLLPGIHQPVNIYDEGIIAYSAVRVMDGQVMYRDFWSIYSPAQFYLLAAAFKLFGASIQVERLWDTAMRSLVPLFAYLVATRLITRRLALVAWATVTAWVAFYTYSYQFNWVFYGYPAFPAIAFGLGSIWLLTGFFTDQRSRWLVFAGLLLGIAALFRHDFGIYCGAGQAIVLGLFSVLRSGDPDHPQSFAARVKGFGRNLVVFGLSAAVLVVPVAVYFVIQAGPGELIFDLFTFPAVIFPRFRALPYPEFSIPDNLVFYLPFAVFLMAGAVAFLAIRRRTPPEIAHALCILMLILFGLFGFNQARIRSDVIHTPAFFVPALILIVVLLRGIPRASGDVVDASSVLSALAVLMLVLVLVQPLGDRFELLTDPNRLSPPITHGVPRASTAIVNPNMAAAVLFILQNTQPNERIFVGNTFHDKIFVNEPMFYFLAERHSATRYHELHPGVATTAPVQQEIVNDLEKYHVNYMVLSSQFEQAHEPNESSISSGVYILDDYIHSRFQPMMQYGPYMIWKRVS